LRQRSYALAWEQRRYRQGHRRAYTKLGYKRTKKAPAEGGKHVILFASIFVPELKGGGGVQDGIVSNEVGLLLTIHGRV
jgi:hypothetical protein